MSRRIALCLGVVGLIGAAGPSAVSAQADPDIPRTPSGRPDLSGTYDTATVTPLQRPREFGDRLTLTQEEAAIIASDPDGLANVFNLAPAGSDERAAARAAEQRAGFETREGDREAPPAGGDGSGGAAGNVGGYNTFWIDRGEAAFQIDGLVRTSIITDPPDGRQPPLTDGARAARAARAGLARPNDGTAWWLEDDLDAPGPYDHPEQRPHAERCLMGFGSTAGPPMLSVLYNNMKRIVQTDDTVMILVEMVHDARIVRMNREHNPPRSGAGWATRSATGRGTPSSSTPPTSPTTRPSAPPPGTCTSSSGSPGSTPRRSSISSRWTTPRSGPPPGAASTSGPPRTTGSTSTPVTRRTTRSAASCAAPGSSRRTRGSRPRPARATDAAEAGARN